MRWALLLAVVLLLMGLAGRDDYQDSIKTAQETQEILAQAKAWAVTR